MINSAEQFLSLVDRQIAEKHLLKHDFYRAWTLGKLSKECLQEYAKHYYQHVKAFPTYLAALLFHAEDPDTRKKLLVNLVEEEGGVPNHPELWKRFTLRLGVTEEELAGHTPNDEIKKLIESFKKVCLQETVLAGIAALYAYESQIPEICISKIAGLKENYEMSTPEDWEYFRVHIEADKEHAAVEKELMARHYSSVNAESALRSVGIILDHLWDFLSSLCQRYQIGCSQELCEKSIV